MRRFATHQLIRNRVNEFEIRWLDLYQLPSYSRYLSALSFEAMLRDVATSNELVMRCVYIPLRDDSFEEDYTELCLGDEGDIAIDLINRACNELLDEDLDF